MPKRTAEYMEQQRAEIAQAALATMLEKGFYNTSLRDVSRAAGISLGALCVHFANKDELILEVCRFPGFQMYPEGEVSKWVDYEAPVRYLKVVHDSKIWRQRIRLSLEFAAEIALGNEVTRGASLLLQTRVEWHRRSLKRLYDGGEIELPLGLVRSARACHRLITGTWYMIAADYDLDIDGEIAMLLATLREIVGREVRSEARTKDIRPSSVFPKRRISRRSGAPDLPKVQER